MNPVPVDSSSLATVAYDPVPATLRIEFRDGTVYHYFRVPTEVHQALLHASSKGRYFNLAIRGRFSYAPAAGSLS
jgi:KTSC domain